MSCACYDFASARTLTIGHMHGLRDLSGKQDTPERIAQAEKFAALIRSVVVDGDGLVACGDFNVTPDSATFAILAELGLADLVVGRGFDDTRTSHYVKPGRFADYLLVNQPLREMAFEVVASPEVSDHRPLLLTVWIKLVKAPSSRAQLALSLAHPRETQGPGRSRRVSRPPHPKLVEGLRERAG